MKPSARRADGPLSFALSEKGSAFLPSGFPSDPWKGVVENHS